MFAYSFSKFSRNNSRFTRAHARCCRYENDKKIFFFSFKRPNSFAPLPFPSLKAANGPRFFCLPLYAHEKYGHPISGAVVRSAHHWKDTTGRWYRAELFVIQPGLRTKNGRTYIHDKSRCCRWSRVAVEHCTNIVHCSQRRYEPAGASCSYFIEAGRPPPSIDRLVKCPRATVPRHHDTVRAPFRQETRYVGDNGVKGGKRGGSFDQKEWESSYPIPRARSPKLRLSSDCSLAADAAVRGRRYRPGEMEVYRTINRTIVSGEIRVYASWNT